MVHNPMKVNWRVKGLFKKKDMYYKGPVKVPFKWSDPMLVELDAAVVANLALIKESPLLD